MNPINQISELIANYLTDKLSLNVVAVPVLLDDGEELEGTQVRVVPGPMASDVQSRSTGTYNLEIGVSIRKNLAALSECDTMNNFTYQTFKTLEDAGGYLAEHLPSGLHTLVVSSVELSTLFSQNALAGQFVFDSMIVIHVTYLEKRGLQ